METSSSTSSNDSNGIRLIAAGILFILTLLMGTIPVYLLEFSTKYFSRIKNSNENSYTLSSPSSSPSTSTSTTKLLLMKNHKRRWFHHDRIVQFLTQIGGGVLFYTAFVHMLPEIRENYESYLNDNNDKSNNMTNNVINKTNLMIFAGDDNGGGGGDEGGDEDSLPLVDLCACAGLFGIFLLEELMHLLLGNHGHGHGHHSNDQPQQQENVSNQNKRLQQRQRQYSRRLSSSFRQCSGDKQVAKYSQQINDDFPPPSTSCSSSIPMNVGENSKITTTVATTEIKNKSSPLSKKLNNPSTILLSSGFSETHPISLNQQQTIVDYNTCSKSKCSHPNHQHNDNEQKNNVFIVNNENEIIMMNQNNNNDNNVNDHITDNKSSIWPNIIDNFLLILAFSCHSIFDGISIGVQTKHDEIWTMLIAILSHKLLIAFILSFQIYEKCNEKLSINPLSGSSSIIKHQRRQHIKGAKLILWFFSTLFALMSPIGIFIVMIMNNQSDTPNEKSLHIIILAAISAGTILYIVFFEIIDKQTTRLHLNGLVQWIAMAIGFGLMHLISQLFHE
uniref:Myb-like protein A n=1 Tax=Dermatophagoides pteronyssinus TaxID=6956 RepID=A0A6P6YFQ0_DERPT|nr:myb-like protein A [Dermatophagoides pteronyssinus]